MPNNFNLVDEPWLPVVWGDGTAREVGLRDALVRAHEIRELVDGSPLVTVSLHRLLLAILHRNFGPKSFEDWKDLWRGARWDADVLDRYFAEWRHRFDLFDAARPFYQSMTLKDGTKVHPPALLAMERSAGNNPTIFDHSFAASRSLMSPAEAARQLVARQAYSLGGGVSDPFNFSQATLTAGFSVLALGDTLFQTLALNLTQYGSEHPILPTERDQPIWEQDDPHVPTKNGHDDKEGTRPRGPIDHLTWQSRRIKLLTQDDPLRVIGVQLSQNLKPHAETYDPFKSFAMSKEQGWVARRLDPDRAVWRDSHAIFQQTSESGRRPVLFNWLGRVFRANRSKEIQAAAAYPLSILGLGREATAKAADVSIWRHERFTVPLAYLEDTTLLGDLREMLELAEDVGRLLGRGTTTIQTDGKTVNVPRPFQLLAQTLLAVGENRADPKRVEAAIDHLAPQQRYWAGLEVPFRALLRDLAGDAPDAAREAWAIALQRAAWEAFREATSGLDRTARALEAVARAEHELRRRLYGLLHDHLPAREGVTA